MRLARPASTLFALSAIVLVTIASSSTVRADDPPPRAWVHVYNSEWNHQDEGKFLAVDTPDRIYVAGGTYDPTPGGLLEEYLLVQIDGDGNTVWSRHAGGPSGDELTDLLIPEPGQVVVTGISSTGAQREILTIKYDQEGTVLWDRRFPASTVTADLGPKLAVDADGNILVSGSDNGDYLILKYSPGGTLLWDRAYDGDDHASDIATDIAAGPDGSVYVTGAVDDSHAFTTVKYSPAGAFLWDQAEPGDIGSVFPPNKIAVGPDGNPVVAGSPESTCGVFQFKIWKCDAATGAVLWHDSLPAVPCDSFTFADMEIDREGNIASVSSGSIQSAFTHFQVTLHAPDGTRLWFRSFDGPGDSEDVAFAITTDRYGNVYAAGYTTFPPQNRDYLAVRYTRAGDLSWSVGWSSDAGTNDIGMDVAVDAMARVTMTGFTYDPQQNDNAVTVQFRQAVPAGAGEDVTAPRKLALALSPNPMRQGDARIAYDLAEDGPVQLDLLGIDGRIVRRLVDEPQRAGAHEARWSAAGSTADASAQAPLPAGIYLVRLRAGGIETSAKWILLP